MPRVDAQVLSPAEWRGALRLLAFGEASTGAEAAVDALVQRYNEATGRGVSTQGVLACRWAVETFREGLRSVLALRDRVDAVMEATVDESLVDAEFAPEGYSELYGGNKVVKTWQEPWPNHRPEQQPFDDMPDWTCAPLDISMDQQLCHGQFEALQRLPAPDFDVFRRAEVGGVLLSWLMAPGHALDAVLEISLHVDENHVRYVMDQRFYGIGIDDGTASVQLNVYDSSHRLDFKHAARNGVASPPPSPPSAAPPRHVAHKALESMRDEAAELVSHMHVRTHPAVLGAFYGFHVYMVETFCV